MVVQCFVFISQRLPEILEIEVLSQSYVFCVKYVIAVFHSFMVYKVFTKTDLRQAFSTYDNSPARLSTRMS